MPPTKLPTTDPLRRVLVFEMFGVLVPEGIAPSKIGPQWTNMGGKMDWGLTVIQHETDIYFFFQHLVWASTFMQ